MKTIMVSGRNFKCSLEINDDLALDDLIPQYQSFLAIMMKLAQGTFYSNRLPEVAKKIKKILKEELAIAKKLAGEQNNENPSLGRRL